MFAIFILFFFENYMLNFIARKKTSKKKADSQMPGSAHSEDSRNILAKIANLHTSIQVIQVTPPAEL